MALTRVSRHIIDDPFNPTTVSATDVTATNINASGIGTVGTLNVTGDLTVQGTTTTLDTILTEVDRLEVAANNSTVGAAITQTGSGDILRLFDGASQKVTIDDEGNIGVGAGADTPHAPLHIRTGTTGAITTLLKLHGPFTSNTGSEGTSIDFGTAADTSIGSRIIGTREAAGAKGALRFCTGRESDSGFNDGRMVIDETGKVGINQTAPAHQLDVKISDNTTYTPNNFILNGAARLHNESTTTNSFASLVFRTATGDNAIGFVYPGTVNQADFVICNDGGANGVERLRITSDGKVRVPDNGKFVAGDGDDLQIYNNGTHSYIDNVTNGALIIRNTSNDVDVVIESDDGSGNLASYFRADGSTGETKLYHYGNQKLATKSNGIQVTGQIDIGTTSIYGTGDISMGDSDKLRLGAGDDLRIYHNGSHSYIDETGDGNLYIRNGTKNSIFARTDGEVILYHNGNNKFETTSTGASVTGNLNLGDNNSLYFGDSDDLEIKHNSGTFNSILGSPELRIQSASRIQLKEFGTTEVFANFIADGAVELFYDNSKKLETTTTGAKVTGALEVTQEYPSIRPTLDLNFAATKTLDRRITFTRDSVGTYVDENGLVKYASNNVPRFDHDPDTGESLGLLIEESRTNLAPYGNNMSQYGSVNMTKTANDAVAPDGTTTATKLEHGGGGNNWYLDYGITSINASGAGSYTYSVWVKAPDDQPDDYYGCRIAILTSTGNNTESVFSIGKTWRRISITKTYASESGTIRIHPIIYRNSPGNTDNGKVIPSYVWVWGSQWEQGTFATSYIPTSGSTVTRDDDDAVIKGTNFSDIYNETEGTVFAEFNTKVNTGTTSKFAISLRDPANNDNYIAVKTYAANLNALVVKSGGSSVAELTVSNSVVIDQFRRVAGSFKLNDFDAADGGTLLTGDTSGAMPTSITQMDIGRGWTNSEQKLEGHIKSIKYYNKKLPDAQLQGLTQQ